VNDWKRRIADRLAARAPRYNDPVEHRRARHIGEIIRERHSRLAQDLTAAPGPKYDVFSRALKIPRLLLGAMLDVLATIGWFVTLPFITRDDRALTTREQSRG
jgi:hypothetical protein